MWKEFKEFAFKGNVMDLAIGVIIGGAFGKIVTSLVSDIIMPVIGAIFGETDFNNYYFALDFGRYQEFVDERLLNGIKEAPTLADVKNLGIPVLSYGSFFTVFLDFLIVAASIFVVIKGINTLRSKLEKKADVEEEIPEETVKKCIYCCTEIDIKATRCPNCTSVLTETGLGKMPPSDADDKEYSKS